MLENMRAVWPTIQQELRARRNSLTDNLIAENNEQTRGRIKEMEDLINLPTTLYSELRAIEDALAEL